jgi:hypothetical protein
LRGRLKGAGWRLQQQSLDGFEKDQVLSMSVKDSARPIPCSVFE